MATYVTLQDKPLVRRLCACGLYWLAHPDSDDTLCPDCLAESARLRSHRERALARSRAYQQAHREQVTAYQRFYYQAHRERAVAYQRSYYQAHRAQAAGK